MRVLIIEDDPGLRRSLSATLKEEGFAVDQAADGEEGLYKASEGLYDALLLDVMMPKLDGWQVLERLRPQHSVPVLMLTARDSIPDRIKGLNTGADDYLTKPFDSDELVARLRALIRRTAGKAQSKIEIKGLVLDTARRSLSRDDCEIELTAREYSLFEYLALHRGEVVSRSLLYERLFDENDNSLSNLLDVHVSNLRKKLGSDSITTRRGHGYCIE
ncbi:MULTISPECIES: response regulator transcription factor [unclassified Lentimonas]|uniref:response regulator transcription factor n=1 Tax=unclassified Lentimonas TaxID=2630993 RepID=UPI001322DF80|nr:MULTISPECIES: response regulator transcription factor [unclassified Lentimonas]CAA6676707.1 Phosphate regulon transcriptional regulatory protein PhoB (SphR) [Lentimonas sp. CC4]CAA6684628.1 Phosphate regulon transcriptional regulatory protein PhoB (SphR) [Lentimonas sp. CC6]CAA6694220.1 Phosphate regulon transcriptional regulatory protein PhoB (SphR) [Lentimonas sp. CC19]CAA6694286.1 Phosphate regulon transcriptional regulatory protein PhoB (SphR) [Lentimonas sp. CC10]CAA7070402.1 Phosphate